MTNPLYDTLFAPLAQRDGVLLHLANGQQISGRAFHGMVAQAALALRAAGVEPGDRVAVQLAKSPQALAIYGATVAIGAVFLPLNTAYTPDEVGYFLGNATPRLFLCDPSKSTAIIIPLSSSICFSALRSFLCPRCSSRRFVFFFI